jgi:fimbrial chaperone protein
VRTFDPRALRVWALGALCAALLTEGTAVAGMSVSPVYLNLTGKARATSVKLQNSGTNRSVQARVYRWAIKDGKEELTPTDAVAASPPIAQVPANGTQMIRLVRKNPAPVATEEAYRVLVDELPSPEDAARPGVTVLTRSSIPLFIEPERSGLPDLQWTLARCDKGWLALSVENRGERRALIKKLALRQVGKEISQREGLIGYVLVGQGNRWLPGKAPAGAEAAYTLAYTADVGTPQELPLSVTPGAACPAIPDETAAPARGESKPDKPR